MSHLLPTQRTPLTAEKNITKKWILVDADGQNLGRLSAQIAYRLRGKHRVDFSTHQDVGDFVVVVNAEKIKVTGKKLDQKIYHKHSGYTGGLTSMSLREKLDKNPVSALELAVRRMLPKGSLGRKMFRNLKVYTGTEHPHQSQKPEAWTPAHRT
ncbi:MAG TPA: 50S ribosomal protein L13 [Leptospiraceae bacterium]|nr:50S ribosomal protein L13 [Spirochaetaceae bacterium]HBS04735.1 50S ribosomal protein L13 [Leptospiraceae bacterium]|tara:strand:- start:176 stop:637 length:462 start_codon:yes stop_codon:yes gene_type:complete